MSCNRPNIYGGFSPYGSFRGGGEFVGYGGGYGCVGCVGKTDPDYSIGYGVGPGSTIPNIIHSGSPQTQVALGSFYTDTHDNSNNSKKNKWLGLGIVLFIVLLLFILWFYWSQE